MTSSADEINSGDTAFILFATTVVMLQTPGMGLTQAGLVRQKNSLTMLMQTFTGMVIGSLLWVIIGYSLVFGDTFYGFIGSPYQYIFCTNVSFDRPYPGESIPEAAYATFQMMFALMTPLIVSGSWVEKMTFEAFILFMIIWPFLSYYPMAHWIWNKDGWLYQMGCQDFSGGVVIHANAGCAGLVVSMLLQKRIGYKSLSNEKVQYHNLTLTMIGASFIWAGWYSFNGGSALGANAQAALALFDTHVAACTGSIVWLFLDYLKDAKYHMTSIINGAFAGLAAITAGSGYTPEYLAMITGLASGLTSYFGGNWLKKKRDVDDVLDVFALQGIPGIVGGTLVGVFADSARGGSSDGLLFAKKGHFIESVQFLGVQILAVVVGCLWSFVFTWITMKIIRALVTVNIDAATDHIGLDTHQIGETSYQFIETADENKLNYALCKACKEGKYLDVLKILTDPNNIKLDIDFKDYDSRTALHIASAYNHIDCVKLLLKSGADPMIYDRWDGLAIDETINDEIRDVLLQYGSQEAEESSGIYRFLRAANDGDLTLVQTMIDHGMRLDVRDYDQRTALHLAICSFQYEIVKYLVDFNFQDTTYDILLLKDRWQNTPIDNAKEFCSKHKKLRSAKLIWKIFKRKYLSWNEDSLKSFSDNLSKSKLSKLKRRNSSKKLKNLKRTDSHKQLEMLEQSDADSEFTEGPRYDHHFDAEVFELVKNGDIKGLKLMVKHGSILDDILDYDNRNLLHVACCQSDLKIVKYLVQQNVNINQRDSKDYTPLYEAMSNWNNEIVAYLKQNGAILISGILGSKLCHAAFDGNILKLDSMLSNNPKYIGKVNIADYDHRTALHLACCNGHFTTTKWLIEHGADPNRKDRFGNKAIDDAIRYGHKQIVEYLEKSMAEKEKKEKKEKDKEIEMEQKESVVDTLLNINMDTRKVDVEMSPSDPLLAKQSYLHHTNPFTCCFGSCNQ